MIVKPRNSDGEYWALSPSREYVVLEVCMGYVRIVDDTGRPFLYPADGFVVIDPNIPNDWIRTEWSPAEFATNPKEFQSQGFFERLFDHDQEATRVFKEYAAKHGISLEDRRQGGTVNQQPSGATGGAPPVR